MIKNSNIHKILRYWNSFWIALLLIYIGIGLIDAFTGSGAFFKNWQTIIFWCLPLYILGSWAIDKNTEMEAKNDNK